jgi:hypothetical protein
MKINLKIDFFLFFEHIKLYIINVYNTIHRILVLQLKKTNIHPNILIIILLIMLIPINVFTLNHFKYWFKKQVITKDNNNKSTRYNIINNSGLYLYPLLFHLLLNNFQALNEELSSDAE